MLDSARRRCPTVLARARLAVRGGEAADLGLRARHACAWTRPASGDVVEALRAGELRTPAIVQPFVEEITTAGEWSLVFVEGELTHAVLKRPAAGRVPRAAPPRRHRRGPRAAAGHRRGRGPRVLAALPERPLYARIDGVERASGFTVMEVEVNEPGLFFDAPPPPSASPTRSSSDCGDRGAPRLRRGTSDWGSGHLGVAKHSRARHGSAGARRTSGVWGHRAPSQCRKGRRTSEQEAVGGEDGADDREAEREPEDRPRGGEDRHRGGHDGDLQAAPRRSRSRGPVAWLRSRSRSAALASLARCPSCRRSSASLRRRTSRRAPRTSRRSAPSGVEGSASCASSDELLPRYRCSRMTLAW